MRQWQNGAIFDIIYADRGALLAARGFKKIPLRLQKILSGTVHYNRIITKGFGEMLDLQLFIFNLVFVSIFIFFHLIGTI